MYYSVTEKVTFPRTQWLIKCMLFLICQSYQDNKIYALRSCSLNLISINHRGFISQNIINNAAAQLNSGSLYFVECEEITKAPNKGAMSKTT